MYLGRYRTTINPAARIWVWFILTVLVVGQLNSQLSVAFSHERGFYTDVISVGLSAPEDPSATIRYTTDSSKPSNTHGTVYIGPIQIAQTTTLRAIAYTDTEESRAFTQSYMYLDDITAQANINTNNSISTIDVKEALLSLPSISIVSDNINDRDSIEDESEISVELLFPNGKQGFMLHCGIETWGSSPTNPKKSYRLSFKSKYGDKKLEYNLFESDEYETHEYNILPTNKFDKLLLRSGSQDGLNGEFGNEHNAQFLRNRFIMDVGIEMGFPQAHGRYVHVYINGAYVGQYHLMERPDNSWFESYYGYDKDDYEVRRSPEVYWDGHSGEGEGIAHQAMTNNIDLSSASSMRQTQEYIDLESAANYLVLMSFLSGGDWSDGKNALCGGHMDPGKVPYQFVLWDVDLSLGQGGKWHPLFSGDVNWFNAPFLGDGPVPDGLVQDPEFQQLMADQLHCACLDDGPLNAVNAANRYNERAEQIERSITAEAARWGNYAFTNNDNVDVPHWNKNTWQSERAYVTNTFLPQRTVNIIDHFKTNSVYPDTEAVVYSHNGGQYDDGYQLGLSHPNNKGTIYYTLDGTDPRDFGGSISSTALIYNSPITLSSGVYEIRARVLNGIEWSAMCPKKFYIGQDYSQLQINEIHYNPASEVIDGEEIEGKDLQFLEIKNSGSTDVFLTDLIIDKGITVLFSDTVKIPANDFLILAEDELGFELKYGFKPDIIWEGKLDDGGERLRLLGPDRGVIDELSYDDLPPWNNIPDAGLYSLALRLGNWDNASYDAWGIQQPYLTPGAINIFDTDGDGVIDMVDQCPGSDDTIDTNNNNIPDGCECPDDVSEITRTNIIVNRNAKFSIETNGYVPVNHEIFYEATTAITLLPNFEIKTGALFTAQIKSCE